MNRKPPSAISDSYLPRAILKLKAKIKLRDTYRRDAEARDALFARLAALQAEHLMRSG